jgi:Galactose oxidase, central domain
MTTDLLWTQRQDTGPTVRVGATAVFDTTQSCVVLFGGATPGGGEFADTWQWDGDAWTQVADTGPSARSRQAMVYDTARSRVVLFGGAAGAAVFGDTWEWDGAAWTQVADTGPDPRSGHTMAFHPAAGRTVLFGGSNAGLLSDTWLWDGHDWTQVQDIGPSARQLHAMASNPTDGKVYVYGGEVAAGTIGDTWAWDGSRWAELAHFGPPAAAGAGMVGDGAGLLLHGGVASITAAGPVYAGTWRWNGQRWTQQQDIGPGPRWQHAMVFDESRSTAVLFGGVVVAPTDQSYSTSGRNDTWEAPAAPVVTVAALTVSPSTISRAGGTIRIAVDLDRPRIAPLTVLIEGVPGQAGPTPMTIAANATSGATDIAIPKGTSAGDVTMKARLGASTATGTLTISPTALLESLIVTPHTVSLAHPRVDVVLTVSGLAPGQVISVAIAPPLDGIVITEPDTTGTLSVVSLNSSWVSDGIVTFSANYNNQTLTADVSVTP